MSQHLIFVALFSLWTGLAFAEEEPDKDPDASAVLAPLPRNLDMIGPTINASMRAGLGKTSRTTPVISNNASQGVVPGLTERDLRYFAARGIGPTVNVCSLVQTGRSGAAQPVISNSRVDINCVAGGIVIGK